MNRERHSIAGNAQPDDQTMDWSQIGETMAMLALAVAQIETTMKDGSQSVDKLSTTFLAMASNTLRILEITQQDHSSDSIADSAALKAEIHRIASGVSEEIQQSIIAFQFYDRLSQRLDHVSHSLEQVGHLMADNSARYKHSAWKHLQNQIKSNYTMEAERIMFEHIMAGHTVSQALQIYRHHFNDSSKEDFGTTDEVELF
ncbi:hypothetical protein [Oceanobacter mangrovi]|uniref:hypothetical protein n=1 Tax=Oceanobacter mangrovi TaxID=2862510 RepID=UPI001C8DEA12|nr:hypothetical protein [Oceanobacter mangrovi]